MRIRELEAVVQDLAVGQVAVTRQFCSDTRGDRELPFAVPAKRELRLLLQVFDIEHRGRTTVNVA
jgi:hypothetical protein